MYHTIETIYLHIFTQVNKASFEKNTFGELKPIQTKIIPFSERTFKIKLMLGLTLFSILLTLAVSI